VLVGKYTRRVSFWQLAPGQTLVVALLALLAVPLGPARTLHWTGRLVLAVVVTAVFATAFAFTAQAWAQQFTPPAHTALIFALEPVFALLTSMILTREHLSEKAVVGAALLLVGMIVSEFKSGTPVSPA